MPRTDITYVPTWAGFLHLAIVLDVFSRRIVGWSMSDSMHADVVVDALDMAVWNRQPTSGVIHHSDQGSPRTPVSLRPALPRGRRRAEHGQRRRLPDNAMAESFFATLETELIARPRFPNRTEARLAVLDFIETFYNRRRRHSSIGNLSPADYERRFKEGMAA